ncbi:hypothetical protein DV965_17770, partial [Staphylococcus pseudintermedius]|uniref:hypothetical protein n=1 Tax=Staphylococcus pseudintermedius TaxID=283734 RepID=UPI000E3AC42E
SQFGAVTSVHQARDEDIGAFKNYVYRMPQFIHQHHLIYLPHDMDDTVERRKMEPVQVDHAKQTHPQNAVISEKAQLLHDALALKHYLRDKRRSIIDKAYI